MNSKTTKSTPNTQEGGGEDASPDVDAVPERITVDIFGCCYNRDTFNGYFDGPYEVNTYILRTPIPLFNQKIPEKFRIDDKDLDGVAELYPEMNELSHNFLRRMYKYAFNGIPIEEIEKNRAEWVMISPYYSGQPVMRVYDKEQPEDGFFVQCEIVNKLATICNYKGFGYEYLDDLPNREEREKWAFDWIKRIYGDKIILMFGEPAELDYTWDGVIKKKDIFYKVTSEFSFCHKAIETLNPHFIDIPFLKMARDSFTVHYREYVYEYLREMVDNIIRGIGNSNEIRVRYKKIAFDAVYKDEQLVDIALRQATGLVNRNESLNEIMQLLHKHTHHPKVQNLIGKAYANQVPPRFDDALYWFKLAEASGKIGCGDYVYTLDRIGTPQAMKEKMEVIERHIFRGESISLVLMARSYRDGKGMPKNLELAAVWMRKATERNIGWAKNELFDILWRIGTPDSYKEMIDVATAFAEAGDGNAMGRLGRAYREGKGVEQNLIIAADWMRKASNKNVGWAKNELFDILWRIGTPESYKEMIDVATAFAEAGDGAAMGRMGRAYRDGKGVEQNLNIAADWMRKAVDRKIDWVSIELFDILWRIGTPESFVKAVEVISALAEKGDADAMGRLGRAYRDGKGVDKDIETAIMWMRKATKKKLKWENELKELEATSK